MQKLPNYNNKTFWSCWQSSILSWPRYKWRLIQLNVISSGLTAWRGHAVIFNNQLSFYLRPRVTSLSKNRAMCKMSHRTFKIQQTYIYWKKSVEVPWWHHWMDLRKGHMEEFLVKWMVPVFTQSFNHIPQTVCLRIQKNFINPCREMTLLQLLKIIQS